MRDGKPKRSCKLTTSATHDALDAGREKTEKFMVDKELHTAIQIQDKLRSEIDDFRSEELEDFVNEFLFKHTVRLGSNYHIYMIDTDNHRKNIPTIAIPFFQKFQIQYYNIDVTFPFQKRNRMDFYIQPKRRPQGQKVTRKLNLTKLKNQLTAQDLQSHMDSKLLDIQSDQSSIDEQWESFRDTVHSITLETLGQVTRLNQDWFDENDQEIQKLLEEKRRLLRAHQNDNTCTAKKAAYNNIHSTVQVKLRLMQDA
ncbi:Hypothetical predicted protein [Octopus vulgaris]|uniref:Uncharacterized protein n=1 Tax=Octopus vulgaris TaxID=6645 RepID=A0AA36B4K2_OCTVU|nr:Hypothetical predicted protein [Octopus vulgaris]